MGTGWSTGMGEAGAWAGAVGAIAVVPEFPDAVWVALGSLALTMVKLVPWKVGRPLPSCATQQALNSRNKGKYAVIAAS